uniref:Probable protein-export membrane protein SecG n=1 Tax=Sebdenia flabellata TaxID=42024 RepID=A0A1C9C9N8_9FLOR|nr:preprotein translocase subunit G [Sebdenia flabellata]AOM65103.1 preprotein translocase subunit G [Sebdenia flabellata]
MKIIWYFTSCLTILLILFNSPKVINMSSFSNSQQMLNITRGTQRKLQIITTITILVFFVLTVFFALYSYQ